MFVTGGTGKLLWKKALATAVLAFTTALIVNLADPGGQVYSAEWLRHFLVAAVSVTVVMEAKYWRDWANTILGESNDSNTGSTSNPRTKN